jgi:ribokinase
MIPDYDDRADADVPANADADADTDAAADADAGEGVGPGTDLDVDVCVVGSVNRDLLFPVARLPRPGQTVLAGDMVTLLGGKGANQAVAAARLGRSVALLARVGEADGAALLAVLAEAGVDTAACLPTPDTPSGHAALIVASGTYAARSADGADGADAANAANGADSVENVILVSPGANARLTPADVATHGALLAAARICLVQQEIRAETVAAAIDAATGTVILNPAPYRPLSTEILRQVDVLVPNAGELGDLLGAEEPDTPEQAIRLLRIRGADLPCNAVIVTLGAQGAVVAAGTKLTHVTAPAVTAVDTVGAGDTFCGALADALARGADLVEAARWAVHAASLAVTKQGAQGGMPTAEEVAGLLRAS